MNEQHETVKVTVTEIPVLTLDRIRVVAVDNGVTPNSDPAVIRWALAQCRRILEGKSSPLLPLPIIGTDATEVPR